MADYASTVPSHIRMLVDDLQSSIHRVLGDDLLGLYLTGSLVIGDFDETVSDIDLVAVTRSLVQGETYDALHAMHDDFAARHPHWQDRVEVIYVPSEMLRNYHTERKLLAIISPGEPFHYREAGGEFKVKWYDLREYAIPLFGPPPAVWIEPISRAEFIAAIRHHAEGWRTWIDEADHRGFQAYAIITLCRALYAVTFGEQVSKPRAARWAQTQLPQWAALIEQALVWRQDLANSGMVDPDAQVQARRFVDAVTDRILAASE